VLIDLDGNARQVWNRLQSLHQAGEHRHPDMLRSRLLWPRFQRYTFSPILIRLFV
jgi:hypothetical protein